MAKYKVTYTCVYPYEVEAKNEDEAFRIADRMFERDAKMGFGIYDYVDIKEIKDDET